MFGKTCIWRLWMLVKQKQVQESYPSFRPSHRKGTDMPTTGMLDFGIKGSIRENELARVFNFDRDLGKDLDSLKDAINKAQNEVEAENWEEVSTEVKNVKKILLDFEDKLSEREKHFRPLDIKDM